MAIQPDPRTSGRQPEETTDSVPFVGPPLAPEAGPFWRNMLVVGWVILILFLLDRISILLADYWFFESVGFREVFMTNFRTGAVLFSVGLVVGFIGVALAGFTNPVSRGARWFSVNAALILGILGGYFLALRYQDFLLTIGQVDFGKADPVFGKDISFYTFTLPSVWTTLTWLLMAVGTALVFSVIYAHMGREERDGSSLRRLTRVLGHVATPLTLFSWLLFSVLVAVSVWLLRYDVLIRDNTDSGIFTGASYVDITGVLSTVNYYTVTAVVIVGVAMAVAYLLFLLRREVRGEAVEGWRRQARLGLVAMALLLSADFLFRVGIMVREVVLVTPNEPVIQLPYIEEHINATRAAYGLEDFETRSFIPSRSGDPLPTVEELLESPTLRNAPLWPGFVSSLERLIDPQHRERVLLTEGNSIVYGPVLEIFQQQEKLRAYYDFMDVDAVRYRHEEATRLLVSAVREIPLVEPQPWLAWWGQQFVLFTHGYGLVAAPANGVTPSGDPVYAVRDIPGKTTWPSLDLSNPSVYYGEGAGSVAFSNVRRMKELDYPTDEGRAEILLDPKVNAGVHIDSLLKRLVFGWNSREFFNILFSRLVGEETRIHYYRTPMERVGKVAPFLYLDTDPWAVAVDGRIVWMVNGITYTDRYPYSQLDMLGDKSDERSPTPLPWREANYARDAVKIVMDAYTGELSLYRISDDPVLETWAQVYPNLFTPGEELPPGVREHIQYPVQLFHLQFDNIYNIYQMKDPMTFFNMEDMWDDGDEVIGPMLDEGKAITFSIEPFHWIADTDGPPSGTVLPRARGPGSQFAMAMVFTPENAPNLRAIPMVYMDGEDYGRIVVLQVPKGIYFMGPEQADAAIDQEPDISRQFDWWNRQGQDVIRGHTTVLVIGHEVLYVEPLFLRSRQNPVTQLKRVTVVWRDQVHMAPTLEEALRGVHTKVLGSMEREPDPWEAG